MPEDRDDLVQVGTSASTRRVLEALKSERHVPELVDAYRLCIAIACAWNAEPDLNKPRKDRTTMFATGTLDTPGLDLRTALAELYPEHRKVPYRVAEDLAEQGATILEDYRDGEIIRLHEIVAKAEELAGIGEDG